MIESCTSNDDHNKTTTSDNIARICNKVYNLRLCTERYLQALCSRAISVRVRRALTAHGLPLSLVFAFNGSSGTLVRLSLCSRLCLTRADGGATLVVGRRTPLAARDNSSVVSSTTSARNRHRRARMIYRDLT